MKKSLKCIDAKMGPIQTVLKNISFVLTESNLGLQIGNPEVCHSASATVSFVEQFNQYLLSQYPVIEATYADLW